MLGIENMDKHTPGKDAKFYYARRDTRWDVYPQQEPVEIVAHDWYGFYALSDSGFWFKTPTSYNLGEEITRHDTESAMARIVSLSV